MMPGSHSVRIRSEPVHPALRHCRIALTVLASSRCRNSEGDAAALELSGCKCRGESGFDGITGLVYLAPDTEPGDLCVL